YGGTGTNVLDGGDGDDVIAPYRGNSTVLGGMGNDTIRVQTGDSNNMVDAGEGNDTINVSFTSSFNGQPNQTVLRGGAGDDIFELHMMYTPNSTVIAHGDGGSDLFRISGGHNQLTIAGFASGEGGDRLDIDYLIPPPKGYNPFGKAGVLRFVQQGADTLLERDADGAAGTQYGFETVLTLAGVTASSLSNANIEGDIDPTGAIEGPVLTGTPGRDSLDGGAQNDRLFGLGGSDVLRGFDGADYLDGGDEFGIGDWLDGGNGNDTLLGGEGNDSLFGIAGDDLLDGGNGNDSLNGGEHDDVLSGGAGNDDLNGAQGDDTIDGGDGDDVLSDWVYIFDNPYYYSGNNILRGGAGNDRLAAMREGSDLLEGGTGNDSLNGGSGKDTLDGGSGNDLITLLVQEGIGNASVLGGDGDDTIKFETSRAVDTFQLTGGSGRDTIAFDGAWFESKVSVTDFQAGAGGDVIDIDYTQSEGGNPFGSAGYMRLVQSGADTLFQFDADGAAGKTYGMRTVLTLKGVQASQMSTDNFTHGINPDGSPAGLNGTPGDDKLFGGADADTITGAAGQDSLYGNGGDDLLQGDDGDDYLAGGAGIDRLDGGAGDDSLMGDMGDDVLLGGAGNDDLYDYYGNDQLYGGDGDDVLNGAGNEGYLSGGNGNDKISMYGAAHVADGGAGNDTLSGSNGDMQISGGAGDDKLSFEATGNSALFGGSGRDVLSVRSELSATPYKVVVNGGADDDIMKLDRYFGNTAITATGGTGVDTYEVSGEGRLGSLAIKDFAVGVGGDRFDVTELFTAAMRASDPYAAGVLLLVKNGTSTVIALDRDGKAGPDTGYVLATVENVTPAGIKDSIVWMDAAAGAAAAPLELVGQAPDAFALA
ncbi:MAG TPA: calcium-binding protein, partial [Telluria sp.]